MRCFGVYGAAHRNLSRCLLVSRQKKNNKIAIFMILSSLRVTFDIERDVKRRKKDSANASKATANISAFPVFHFLFLGEVKLNKKIMDLIPLFYPLS